MSLKNYQVWRVVDIGKMREIFPIILPTEFPKSGVIPLVAIPVTNLSILEVNHQDRAVRVYSGKSPAVPLSGASIEWAIEHAPSDLFLIDNVQGNVIYDIEGDLVIQTTQSKYNFAATADYLYVSGDGRGIRMYTYSPARVVIMILNMMYELRHSVPSVAGTDAIIDLIEYRYKIKIPEISVAAIFNYKFSDESNLYNIYAARAVNKFDTSALDEFSAEALDNYTKTQDEGEDDVVTSNAATPLPLTSIIGNNFFTYSGGEEFYWRVDIDMRVPPDIKFANICDGKLVFIQEPGGSTTVKDMAIIMCLDASEIMLSTMRVSH